MIDLELFGGFDFTQTDEQTDERTLVVVESLSRLKTFSACFHIWSKWQKNKENLISVLSDLSIVVIRV